MNSFWAGLIQQLITTAAGAAFLGISTMLGFYIKKLTDGLKRKSLLSEIDNYVRWAEQYPTFKEYSGEQKFKAVFSKGLQWATENDVNVSPEELTILVESTVQKMNAEKPPIFLVSESNGMCEEVGQEESPLDENQPVG